MRYHSLTTLARRKIIKKVVLLIRYALSTLAEAIGSVEEATWSFQIYVSTFPTSVEEVVDEYETICLATDYGNRFTRWRAACLPHGGVRM